MNYELTCPHCGEETSIEVDVESPSDYTFDDCCQECSVRITEFNHWRNNKKMDLNMEIMNEVSEHWIAQMEYRADLRRD